MRNKREPNTQKRIVAVFGSMAALVIVLMAAWLIFPGGSDQTELNPETTVAQHSPPVSMPMNDRPAPSSPQSESPVAELHLRLLATTVSLDEQFSRATIEDISREVRHVMRIGQQLRGYENVVLDEIETDMVIINNHGRREIVELDPEVPLNPREEIWPVEFNPIPDSEEPGDITEPVFLHGLARAMAQANTQRTEFALQYQGTFAAWEENGEFVGIIANNINKESFFDQLGLRQGDVLMSVNGFDIKSAADNVEILDMLTQETSLYFRVRGIDGEERKCETQTVPVM